MGPSNDLVDLAARLRSFADRLEGDVRKKIGDELGRGAIADTAAAVRADGVPDLSMSGWRRGAPIPIEARAYQKDGVVIVVPERKSAGPMWVLEKGRHMRNTMSAKFAAEGPGVDRKTGETNRTKNGKLRKVRKYTSTRRWNGHTIGRGTWSDAVGAVERNSVDRAMSVLVAEAHDHIVKG